jgi:hypothetical protein
LRGVPCPGTEAKLKVIVNNPTSSSPVVTISGQFQHQQRPVLIAPLPTDYATVGWTYYPTVINVSQSGDAPSGDCIFQPTCTFRQAIASANLLAQFTGAPAILIQFALSPGTMTQPFLMPVGLTGNSTRITLDGTDANGDPYIVGDALAAAQGNQDVFTRAVDLADKTALIINGDNVTIKGLWINNTVTTAPPDATLVQGPGESARIEAVRLDGGASGSCGSCLFDDRNLIDLTSGGTIVNVEGRGAFSNGIRATAGTNQTTIADSWLHHNYASGVLADGVQLTRNVIELAGRRTDGTVVSSDGVGVRGSAINELHSSANLIRNHTSHGVRARPNQSFPGLELLEFTGDAVCGNGEEGIFLFEGLGSPPTATGTGVGVTYNATDGLLVDQSVPSSSTLTFNHNSAFTANAAGFCGIFNDSGASVSAVNNQWRDVLAGDCIGSPDAPAGGVCGTFACFPVQNYQNIAITLAAEPTVPGNALLKGQTLRVQGNGFNAVDGNPTAAAASCVLGSGDVSSNNCCRKKTKANMCVTLPPPSAPDPPPGGSNCVALRDSANRWFPLSVTSVTPTTIVTEVPDTVHLCTGASSEIVRVIKQGTDGPRTAVADHCKNTASL